MNKKPLPIIILVLSVVVVAVALYISKNPQKKTVPIVTNFEQCSAAGYPIAESYPRTCRAGGKTYTENIGNSLEKQDLIMLQDPLPNDSIESPVDLVGRARGKWFFEAVFPIKLYDENGKLLATTQAQAQEDWMTDDFVDFTATLTFDKGTAKSGKIVLEKDNPSGEAKNADQLTVPVKLK